MFDEFREIGHLKTFSRKQLVARADRRAERPSERSSRSMSVGLVDSLLGVTAYTIVLLLVLRNGGSWIGPAVLGCACVVWMIYWHIRVQRERLRYCVKLQCLEEGVRPLLCFNCGYYLRGIDSPRCPECGEPLAPPDAGVNPPHGQLS